MKKYKALIGFLLFPLLSQAQNPELIIPAAPTSPITAVAFSDDTQLLATGEEAGKIILWDLTSLREIRHFSLSSGRIKGLFFSPDKHYLCAVVTQALLYVWKTGQNEEPLSLKLGSDPIENIRFSPQSDRLLVSFVNDLHQLYSCDSGVLLATLESPVVAFSRNVSEMLLADSALYSWGLDHGKKQLLVDPGQRIHDVKATDKNNFWIQFGDQLSLYHKGKKQAIRSFPITLPLPQVRQVTSLTNYIQQNYQNMNGPEVQQWFSPDGSAFLQYLQEPVYQNLIRRWDLTDATLRERVGETEIQFERMFIAPTGDQFLKTAWPAEFANNFSLIDTWSNKERIVQFGENSPNFNTSVSPDGRHILFGREISGLDTHFDIFNLENQTRRKSGLYAVRDWVQFSPGSKTVLMKSLYTDQTLWWLDVNSLDTIAGIHLPDQIHYLDLLGVKSSISKANGIIAVASPRGRLTVYKISRNKFSSDSPIKPPVIQMAYRNLDWEHPNISSNPFPDFFQAGPVRAVPQANPAPTPNSGLPRPQLNQDHLPPTGQGVELLIDIWATDEGSEIDWIALLPDARYILSCDSAQVRIWDFSTQMLKLSVPGHGPVYRINKPGDPNEIQLGRLQYRDGRRYIARYWLDPASLTLNEIDPILEIPDVLEGPLSGTFTLSPQSRYLAYNPNNKEAYLWDLKSRDFFRHISSERHFLGFSPNDRYYLEVAPEGIAARRLTTDEIAFHLITFNQDWCILQPNGLFDASAKAMSQLYFAIGLEVVEPEQLKARYYEPGLLQKLLGFSDERIRPVEDFKAVKLYPKIDAAINGNTLSIYLHERNGGIGKVSIFINGKEVIEEANPLPRRENAKRDSSIQYDLRQHQNYLFRHPDSTNIISIRAYNEDGWLRSRPIELEYRMPAARTRGSGNSESGAAWVGKLDPKLYVVTIGTSDYTGTKMDLQYADQDATMMARALQSVGTSLFTHGDSLEVHCLSTTGADDTGLEDTPVNWQFADKNNIESVFRSIRQRAKAEDVIVVYLSGHGVTYGSAEQAQFHYLTQGIASEDLSDAAIRQAYTISSEELTGWINAIPALKQVLIIDACNSGQIVENLTGGTKALNSSQIRALDRMKDRTGMFVLSGSAADKVSYEAGEYGQGLLTYALLEGMRGVATRKDAAGQELIDVMQLFQYARDRVPELASSINGIQTPMLGFPRRGASIDIGILDESAKANIPIGNKKPVVIKSLFMNQTTLKDDLKLTHLLELAFRKETEEGKDADLIYVDVNDYPNGYTLGGLYTTEEEQIKITIRIFQNGEPIADLKIRPTDDPERLVRYIVREVKRLLRER